MINWKIKRELKNFIDDIEHKNVLDFGCGDSRYRALIEKKNKYTGLDIKENSFPKESKAADVFWDDKTLPFEDESFDIIICSEVLQQVKNLSNTINEIRRVLKQNGKIFATLVFVHGEHDIPSDFLRFTSFGTKKIFEENKFKIIKFEKMLKGKKCVIQVIESAFTKYIDENLNTNFRLFHIFTFKVILLIIKTLFFFLPKNIFSEIHSGNLIIAQK